MFGVFLTILLCALIIFLHLLCFTSSQATFHKSGAPKPDAESRLVKVTATAEDDFWALMDKSSAKILSGAEHSRFMAELKMEQRRLRLHVNLDILEEYASKC
jgi:hypothetical protein